jgi:Domain of unknown function (DUF222)
MSSGRCLRIKVLSDQLRAVDKSIGRLTAKRLSILDEIAKLDAEDGASERQTASRVARLTASTPKQAAGELAMAKQVSTLPKLAEAHANGEISNSQLGPVAAIASASSEEEALAFAKTATSSQLQQRASASRGKLFEERRKAHADRYLGFKPEEGGQSVRIHGRLPFAESSQLEAQLRKIADRLNLCDKERPSPSARMADALLILTKSNASQAIHDHLNSNQSSTQQSRTQTNSSASANQSTSNPDSTVRPKLQTVSTRPTRGADPVAGKDQWPSPEAPDADNEQADPGHGHDDRTFPASVAPSERPTTSFIDYDEEPFPDASSENSEREYFGDEPDDADDQSAGRENTEPQDPGFGLDHAISAPSSTAPVVVVQRADTRLIIHWNAQAGSINFENGPPIDHPRLQAILCDAQIDIQHCDPNGLPTGLITTAHHSDFRQDRYLAFRDGPCRIPECQGIGKTQAHHIFENRIDRTTAVQHMINLCNRCHQTHHDGIFTITGNPEQTITFTYQDGTTLTSNARPLPITLKTPKSTPFAKHQPPDDALDLFAA